MRPSQPCCGRWSSNYLQIDCPWIIIHFDATSSVIFRREKKPLIGIMWVFVLNRILWALPRLKYFTASHFQPFLAVVCVEQASGCCVNPSKAWRDLFKHEGCETIGKDFGSFWSTILTLLSLGINHSSDRVVLDKRLMCNTFICSKVSLTSIRWEFWRKSTFNCSSAV